MLFLKMLSVVFIPCLGRSVYTDISYELFRSPDVDIGLAAGFIAWQNMLTPPRHLIPILVCQGVHVLILYSLLEWQDWSLLYIFIMKLNKIIFHRYKNVLNMMQFLTVWKIRKGNNTVKLHGHTSLLSFNVIYLNVQREMSSGIQMFKEVAITNMDTNP